MTTFAKRASAMALAVGLGAGFALAGVVAPATAATLIVTSSADSGAGSLRDTLASSAPGDTITFAPAVTSIALESSIVITKSVSIVGPGSGGLTISRGGIPNVFDQFSFEPGAASQDLTMSGLTIAGNSGVGGYEGRGLFAASLVPGNLRDITLTDVVVRDQFTAGGPGFYAQDGVGNILIEDSTFSGNESFSNAGGGVSIVNNAGDVVIRDSSFSDNVAGGPGGAIQMNNVGNVAIQSTSFDRNESTGGGAIYVFTADTLVVSDASSFDDNSAGGEAGAIGISRVPQVVIAESSFTSNAANGVGGTIYIDFTGTVMSVTDSTFTSNSSGQSGGAIFAGSLLGGATISGSSFVGNSAANGPGGAVNVLRVRGSFDIMSSTFRNNAATEDTVFHGGAVAIGQLTNIGSMRVDSSTFSGNSATGSPAFGNSLGVTQAEGDLTISNSTFDETGATESYAISMNVFNAGADTAIEYSTITGPGGLQIQQNPGTARIVSSIIDGGAYPAVRVPSGGNAVATSWSLLSSQLFLADMTDGGNNLFSVSDFKLGPLQNNGGATQTRLPLPTSPAFNAGDPAFASPPALDQRGTGFPRVALGRIDIGAVEGEFALADTGAKINYPVLIGGAVLVLLGIGAVVVGQVRRARR